MRRGRITKYRLYSLKKGRESGTTRYILCSQKACRNRKATVCSSILGFLESKGSQSHHHKVSWVALVMDWQTSQWDKATLPISLKPIAGIWWDSDYSDMIG
jgi:hypothetical protein